MNQGRNSAEDKIRSLIDSDEQLHWTGQPYQGFSLSAFYTSSIIGMLFLLVFVIFWEILVISEGGIFSLTIGMLFIIFFLYAGVGRYYLDKLRRENTYYGITDNRVIILQGIFKQGVTSHDITSLPSLSVEENPDGTGTIYLNSSTTELTKMFHYQTGSYFGTIDGTDRLEQIDNAREVYDQIKEIKED